VQALQWGKGKETMSKELLYKANNQLGTELLGIEKGRECTARWNLMSRRWRKPAFSGGTAVHSEPRIFYIVTPLCIHTAGEKLVESAHNSRRRSCPSVMPSS
jgi:hypothetical protein